MSIKIALQSFVVALGVVVGMNACAGLELSDNENENETEQAVLVPPATVTATTLTNTRIQVSWSAVPGAFKYFVYQSQAGGPFVFAGSVLSPTTSRLMINLQPNTLYSFRVSSIDPVDNRESARSDPPASATTLAAAPGAPTNVTATTFSPFQINLTWTAFPTAVKYYVFQSQAGGPFTFRTTVLAPGTAFSATGLQSGTQYCYRLVGVLPGNNESAPSTPDACATTGAGPQAPTSVTTTPISDTRILVQWQPAVNATRYFVYEGPAGGAFVFRGSVLASQQSFLAINLTTTTEYCYRVTTVFSNNAESAPSSVSCATTLVPGAGGFQGYWKLDERGGGTALDSSGFNRNGTIALGAGAGYSNLDKPQIDDNRSAIAFTPDPASAITAPASPAFNLLGSFTVAFWAKLPAAAASVTFIGMRGASCGALGWEIAQDAANGLHFSGQTQLVTAGTSIPVGVWTHVAVTAAAGTMHIFVNGVETSSGPFDPDNTLSASLNLGHVAGCAGGAVFMDEVLILSRAYSAAEVAAVGTLPPAPINVVVSSKTSRSITLSWTPVPGASGYIISKGTAPGNETFYTHSSVNPTFQGDHLSPSTQYSWTVRSVVNRLFSNPSASVVDTTLAPPAAPQNVTATVVTPSRIRVDWSPVPNAFKYYVFRSINGGPFAFTGSVVSPTVTWLSVNLSPATNYAFQVQAEDPVQTVGPPSQAASATTP